MTRKFKRVNPVRSRSPQGGRSRAFGRAASNGVKCPPAKPPSELRSDFFSQNWVIIATGRARRPETFKQAIRKKIVPSPKTCPFCHIKKEEALLIFNQGEKLKPSKATANWTTAVVKNKYPALLPEAELCEEDLGLYRKMNGVGFHEVVITRDHQRSLGQFSAKEIQEVIDAYQERYLDLMNEFFVKYVSIFHNHGEAAGASIFHPHSQIIAAPVIDPDLNRALVNSEQYFKEKKECVYCQMNAYDSESKERIVFENKEFLVTCPFISKTAFEMIISPKKHLPYFERISGEQKRYLAEGFLAALGKLYKGLSDPPYNFYLHTAPCNGKNYNFYHWHFTILPKTAILAGFELCTGIEISTIEPEKAAEYLRKQ